GKRYACCTSRGSWPRATASSSPAATTWSSTGRPIPCGCCRSAAAAAPKVWESSERRPPMGQARPMASSTGAGAKRRGISAIISSPPGLRMTMSIEQLADTARAMVAPGKGIIAIDESTGTIAKRFAGVGVENTEENRRAYREMLLTTPGLGEHISGAILFDETLRQSSKDGVPFARVMQDAGVIPGIKVDKGTHPLAGFPGEVVTEGLDGLRDRLKEYYGLGARFAKWRAVINIGEDIPSGTCIEANSHALARYAALCQEQGLVPMVEPEVLMDGSHDIETCF